jgi:amino-acid N-acetyltransferase
MNAVRAIGLRPARAADQAAIDALVHAERLNPRDLDWRRFCVAVVEGDVVGAAQVRRHTDGSRELGSLVVAPAHRGHGIAALLIERLLGGQRGAVHAVTAHSNVPRFGRWGFVPIANSRAPRALRRNRRLGQIAGGLMALLCWRWPRRLVILARVNA